MNFKATLALLLLVLAKWVAAAEPVGMVLDVLGPVQFIKPAAQEVNMFANLEPGAQIGLGRGAKLVTTLYSRGAELAFAGPARLHVKEDSIEVVFGAKPQERVLQAKDVIAASQGITRRQQQAAISMRNIDPLVWPVHQDAVRETSPEFRFSGPSDDLFLAVFNREAKVIAREALRPGGSVRLPAEFALQRGETYSWTLIEDDGTQKTANRKVFRVLREEEIKLADASRPSSDATVSQWALYAGLLESLWLRTEAKAVWARLAKERPQDRTLARFAQ